MAAPVDWSHNESGGMWMQHIAVLFQLRCFMKAQIHCCSGVNGQNPSKWIGEKLNSAQNIDQKHAKRID